jgi:lysozyme family protein
MIDFNALKEANARRYANAKTRRDFTAVAKQLIAPEARARYVTVSVRTGVPWWFIAVVHEREASQRWDTQLGQGDPLHSVSVHVPAGRGPFKTWEDGAYDALVNCAPHAAGNHDWSAGAALTMLEQYNGLGYAAKGQPSPYVWSGTDQYVSGKYVRDGVYDPSAVDVQLGCAGLLMTMSTMDLSVKFGPVAPPKLTPVPTETAGPPSITNPSKGSIGDFIVKLFSSIFKRK